MYAAARCARWPLNWLMVPAMSAHCSRHALTLEIAMTQRNQKPPTLPNPGPSRPPRQAKPQNPPTEPVEVLGRHKNDGQKDHKGAR